MPLPARSWSVFCCACDLVIGAVEDGHFVHDPACAAPLAIGAGLMRCCRCSGPLSGDPRPLAVMDDEPDEERAPLLRFRRPVVSEAEALQQL